MADPSDNPPAPDSPAIQPKSNHPRADLNQRWLAEISATEKLAAVAAKDGYAPQLARRKIDGAFLTKLNADLKQARDLTGQATGKSTGKKLVTQQEAALRDELIAQLRSVQSAAKQKFSRNKTALADYYMGQNLKGMSRAALEACATAIHEHAADAGLPGIEAAELQALADALAAYIAVQTTQTGAQAGAAASRSQLDQFVATIADQRRELQFAVDGLWAAGKPENAAIRVEFKLPRDKAFKG